MVCMLVFRLMLQRENVSETLARNRFASALVPKVSFVFVALSCLKAASPSAVGCADRLAIKRPQKAFVAWSRAAHRSMDISDAIAAGFDDVRKQVTDVHFGFLGLGLVH